MDMNSPLVRNTRSLFLAIFVCEPGILSLGTGLACNGWRIITCLHTETGSKHELADSGAEATQEGVEGL